MLHLFRKYQKFIFIIVAFVVIVTFVFFGTYQAFIPSNEEKEIEDPVSYTTATGRVVGCRELAMLATFLAKEGPGSGALPSNLFSHQWVSRYFLTPSVASQWVDLSTSSVQEKWARELSYVPYQHPARADLSLVTFWSFLAPELPMRLKELQTASSIEETLETRLELYRLQEQAPPKLLANVLRYRAQEAGCEIDPRLSRGDLALFGYQDLIDWLGQESMEKLARIVIRGMEEAQDYPFSLTEARQELLARAHTWAEQIQNQRGIPVTSEAVFQAFLRQEGYTESTFVNVYRDLRRFEESMEDLSESLVLESLPFEQAYGEANQWVTVDVTHMPPALCLQSLEEGAEFEAYLAALTSSEEGRLPEHPTPTSWVEGTWYQGYVATTSLEDLLSHVTLRQLWEWEELHMDQLLVAFPALQESGLDGLDSNTRADLDQMVRRQIVQEHPEWVDESLKQADMEPFGLFMNGKERIVSYPGITSILSLQQQLDQQDEILGYTQDKNHFFRWLVSYREPNHILTFEEARQQGLLPLLNQEFHGEQLFSRWCARKGLSPQDGVARRFEDSLSTTVWAPLASKTEQKTVKRTHPEWLPFDELMEHDEGQGVTAQEGAFRYRVVERGVDRSLPLQKLQQAKEWLADEVRRPYIENLIQQEVA